MKKLNKIIKKKTFTLRQNAKCMFWNNILLPRTALRCSYTASTAVLSVKPQLCERHFNGKLFSQFYWHVLFCLHNWAVAKTRD